MKFSDNLIKLRKQKGMSQEELGNEINVARQTISKWELGETTPELDKLKELSKLFEVSVDELIGNDTYTSDKCKKPYHEYISKTKIGNLPLVHINIGYGFGNIRKAKGIIAIGNIAKGIFALGGISLGVISIGGIGAGIFTLAGLCLGLLTAIGGVALGTISIGGVALGIFTIGGISIGIYSFGGIAIAKNIAMGGIANGHIAIGGKVNGVITYTKSNFVSSDVRNVILNEFPHTWNIIVEFFSHIR